VPELGHAVRRVVGQRDEDRRQGVASSSRRIASRSTSRSPACVLDAPTMIRPSARLTCRQRSPSTSCARSPGKEQHGAPAGAPTLVRGSAQSPRAPSNGPDLERFIKIAGLASCMTPDGCSASSS
jgi:hypothetical protein